VPRLHIELPDDLHTRAKITAAVRHSTLKALVIGLSAMKRGGVHAEL
jgi:hypothetical protein